MTTALDRLRALRASRPPQDQAVIVTREAVDTSVAAMLNKAAKDRAFSSEPSNSEATKLTKPSPDMRVGDEAEGFDSFGSDPLGGVSENRDVELSAQDEGAIFTKAPTPSLPKPTKPTKAPPRASLGEAERWRALFTERLAEAQAAGLDPAENRRQALSFTTAQWRCENAPPPNAPGGACAGCGRRPVVDEVSFLAGDGKYVWMHRGCWSAYDARRQAEAESAVSTLLCLPL